MKILYKQPQDATGSLSRFGVHNCYFKKLHIGRDRRSITKKSHHHTGFELHIVVEGQEEYEVEGAPYRLESGSFLLIYPNVKHTVIHSAPHTRKYSITFHKQTDNERACFFGSLSERIGDDLNFILRESLLKKEISAALIENNILEILILTLRMAGIKEKDIPVQSDENATVALAKQYIEDNVALALSVTDVSDYCCLSAKQLTRIFRKFEGVSPGEYMLSRRIAKTEELLADPALSLKEISEAMHFNNEYYFNAFFKKHSGMPPGEYRKMLGNT